MTPRSCDSPPQRTAGTLVAIWLLAVLSLWTAAHSLNRWLLQTDDSSEAWRFGFWTGAKLVAWLCPTFMLLRRCGGASARWLGLTTGKGLGVACLGSVLWISVQVAGGRFHWPLFSRPPAELTWLALATSLLVAPCFEELMFRGAMLRVLREGGHGGVVCVVFSAFAFALLHVPGWVFRRGLDASIAGGFVSMWAFGTAAGYLAWRVPSLWAPILLHFANNFWSTSALAWALEQVRSR
jgi:membrane protease YdiL (CAAX protease family)